MIRGVAAVVALTWCSGEGGSAGSLAASADTLDAGEVLPLIARADAEDAALLRAHPATFVAEPASFLRSGAILHATAMLPQRPVAMRYLLLGRGSGGGRAPSSSEARVLPLGTPERVRAAGAAAGLRLTPETAIDYLAFYHEASGGAPWARRRVLRGLADVPWLPATETDAELREARARAAAAVQGPRVASIAGGGLLVTATTLRGQTIERVRLEITPDGAVTERGAEVLVEEAPVVQVL